jgi:hypothetical protein
MTKWIKVEDCKSSIPNLNMGVAKKRKKGFGYLLCHIQIKNVLFYILI